MILKKTVFVKTINWNFLLTYGGLNRNRFFWIIGNKSALPEYIISILIKNYENISRNMVGRS